MRQTIAFLIMAIFASPAMAEDGSSPEHSDFSAYSVLIVANDNCDDLHLDPAKLKLGLEKSADLIGWTQSKRRQEASKMVKVNSQKLRTDPQSFCNAAKATMVKYEQTGIRYR